MHVAWSGRRVYDVGREDQRLVRAHEIVHRPSQDLDFATSDNTLLPEIAAHVQDALRLYTEAGFQSVDGLKLLNLALADDGRQDRQGTSEHPVAVSAE